MKTNWRALTDTAKQTKSKLSYQMDGSCKLVFLVCHRNHANTKHFHEVLMMLLMLRRVECRPRSSREDPFRQEQRAGNQELGTNRLWPPEEIPTGDRASRPTRP